MCWWRHFFSCINNTELNWIFFPILLQRFQTCQESSSSRWESLMSKALTSPVYAQAAARCSLWYARWCLPWGDAEPCIFSHSGGWEVQLQTSVWRANATLIPFNCCILQYCTGLLMHSMGLKKKHILDYICCISEKGNIAVMTRLCQNMFEDLVLTVRGS